MYFFLFYFKNLLENSEDRRFQLKRDLSNIARYGIEAPRYAERIWINPKEVNKCIVLKGMTLRKASGLIMDMSDFEKKDLFDFRQVRSCFDHWCSGIPWEDTLSYKLALRDVRNGKSVAGCQTVQELEDRYNKLDILFETVGTEGRLKTRKEINLQNIREAGGIQVSLDKTGNLLLNQGGGFHRFSIALIRELKIIPAQIGIVEKEAIPLLAKYRSER